MTDKLPEIRKGFKLIYQLPKGWDERTRLVANPYGGVIAVHPDFAPVYLHGEVRECKCDCHKPKPVGWDAEVCCPDCGSTLYGGYDGP